MAELLSLSSYHREKFSSIGRIGCMVEENVEWTCSARGLLTAELQVGGQKIGLMTLMPFQHVDLPCAAYTPLNVWVSPVWRNQGYGLTLYRLASQYVNERGALLLSSFSVSATAAAVWGKLAAAHPESVGTLTLRGETHWYSKV